MMIVSQDPRWWRSNLISQLHLNPLLVSSLLHECHHHFGVPEVRQGKKMKTVCFLNVQHPWTPKASSSQTNNSGHAVLLQWHIEVKELILLSDPKTIPPCTIEGSKTRLWGKDPTHWRWCHQKTNPRRNQEDPKGCWKISIPSQSCWQYLVARSKWDRLWCN